MKRALVCLATGLAVALTGFVPAADATQTAPVPSAKKCQEAPWGWKACPTKKAAKAAKASITYRINGRTTATYKEGSKWEAKRTAVAKGLPTKGMCKMRGVAPYQIHPSTPNDTATVPFQKVPCAALNGKLRKTSNIIHANVAKSQLPFTAVEWIEIKLPSGKIVKSNKITITLLKDFPMAL